MDKDNGTYWENSKGVGSVAFTSTNCSGTYSAVTDYPFPGDCLVIDDLVVSVDTAMRVDFVTETSNNLKYRLYLPANGSMQITTRDKMKLGTANKRLMVQTNAVGNIAVTAFYHGEK